MKKLLAVAEEYVKTMEIGDFVTLKFCLCALGIFFGLMIPHRVRKAAAVGAFVVFIVTFVPMMMKFLKIIFSYKREY